MLDQFAHSMIKKRLPDVIITGVKKCGTKALQMFLLTHPEITGTRKESFYYNTNNFLHDFGAYLGQIPVAKGNRKYFLTKTGLKKGYP